MSVRPAVSPASPRSALPFDSSAFSWVGDLPPGRNQFVSFERVFILASAPAAGAAPLHLFADTRYRLFVNDTFVAYGPGRFVTARPEYDSHDLAAILRPGANTVRVEVNYYGCSSFQTMPDGLPGFIAAGRIAGTALDFATPGDWRARVHHAWDAHAPHFSFAQNPAEICDTRRLAAELAVPALLTVASLPAAATPWSKPVPRSTPCPDYKPIQPVRILATGPLANPRRWGVQLHRPGRLHPGRVYHAFTAWIHSPRARIVELDCLWMELALNGEPLAISYPERLGNHGEARASLRAGWNFLSGNIEIVLGSWSLLLGLPRESGCTLHALPDLACAEAFALSPALPARSLPPAPASPSAFTLPAGWTTRASDLDRVTPARIVAWDTPVAASVIRDLPYRALAEVATHAARAALWNFDFGDEYYGQPVLEVEAPAGGVLDVAYDDWKRADGCVALYHSNALTEAADRFILRGGRQRIEVLNPRGGIFLQIVLRVPAGSPPAALTVHSIAVRRRITLTSRAGHFASGDPLLDWAWNAATHTLQASTDEVYSDCPWRERGSYIGDSLVNFHLHRLVSADLSVARRTLDLFGQAQLPDGQLQACAPAWLDKPHADFTLLWILAVRDFWVHTGDTAFASSQLPVVRRILSSPAWKPDADGLWNATGLHVFIDWGVLPSEKEGPANTAVNVLRVAALRAAAELCAATGQAAEAAGLCAAADRVVAALLARVWDEREGRFLAGAGSSTPALHANILALRFDIGPAKPILAYLAPRLRANFRHGLDRGRFSDHVELYFFHFLLPALATQGHAALAESMIAETYGFIKSLGYPTLTERFLGAGEGRGSCCHSWSGAPALYATEYVLGLRLAAPGNPDAYLLAPVDSGRDSVEGSIPHPRGLIRVRWKRRPGGRIAATATVPPGVTLAGASQVDLDLTTARVLANA